MKTKNNIFRDYIRRTVVMMSIMFMTAATAWAAQPVSYLDACTGETGYIHVSGWAYDPDASSQSINVHMYVYTDAACTSQYYFCEFTAGVPRSDVNSAKGITGDHGFNIDIPIYDPGVYWVKLFAIDTNGDDNPQIGSTTAVTVTVPKTLPYNYGFENNDLMAEGWTTEDCVNNSSIQIRNNGFAHSGNYIFEFYSSDQYQYLISPEIDSEGRAFSVSFYYYKSPHFDHCRVGYSTTTNDRSAFIWDSDMTEYGYWTLYKKDLPANAKYIAIEVGIYVSEEFVSFDDFSFSVIEYLPPENLTVSDITDQSATLTWTAPSMTKTITGYAYQIAQHGSSWGTDTEVMNPSLTTVSFDNLLPNTSYDFRIKTLYAEGESSKYAAITILTDCSGSVSLPFFEDFENGIDCWRVVNGDVIYTGNFTNYDSKVFRFWGNAPQYLISPQLDCPAEITVSLYYRITTTEIPKSFQVGYSTTTHDSSAFTWDTEVTCATWGYVKYEHNFPAGTKYIAIKYTSNSEQSLYIDNVSIFVDGALPPAQVSASTIASQGVTLTWDAADGATGYAYQYKKVSENTWSDEVTTTATTAAINGLMPDTDYDVRVKAIYGNNASIYTTTQFTTATALPYEQDFESGMGRWTMVDCYTYWTDIDDIWGTGRRTQAAHDSNVGFQFSSGNPDLREIAQYLISPRFGGDAAITLSFYYRVPANITETIYVGYSTTTNDKEAFTFGDAITFNSSNWTKYEHTFPAEARYFAVKYASNQYKMFIDDFSFEESSAYAKPTTIGYTTVSETEATMAWNVPDGATGFSYQYKKASDAAWSAEATLNKNTVTLSGLTPNTYYNFRVKTLYGSNASNYATYTFQTDASVVDLPYTDGFENGMGGWRMLDCEGASISTTVASHSGIYNFEFLPADHHQYLLSPHFAGGTPMKVSFYYKNYENNLAAFQVGYASSKDVEITWAGNTVIARSGNWGLYETVCPPETQYVFICCHKDGNMLFFDDFSFTEFGYFDFADDADNTTIIENNDDLESNVTLQGRTFYRDGDWNTLCLPFNVSSFTGTPLASATVKELNEETSNLDNNGTLTLNFKDATSIEAGKPYIVKWQLADVLIKSTADWDAFAQNVNNGNTYSGKTVRLTKNISVSTMVGTDGHPFSGTFDGAGHTLNVTINASSTTYAAPFHTIGGGATIQNLTVIGNVVGGNHCAGLVGHIEGSGVDNHIWLCDVRTNINCRSTHCGGVMGHAGSSTTYILDTRFGGSITGEDLTNIGVIWGWSDGNAIIGDCLAAGAYCECAGLDMVRGANNGTISGNIGYKTQNFGNKGTYTTATGNELASLLGEFWMVRNGVVVPIIDPDTPAEVINDPMFKNVTIDATASTSVAFSGGQFVGTYSPVGLAVNDRSNLFLGSDNTLYWPNGSNYEDFTSLVGANSSNYYIGACRAYFHIGSPSLVRAFVLNFGEDNETTGILSTTNLTNDTNSDAWYDLSGRKLSSKPTQKGLYIHGGNKVVIK